MISSRVGRMQTPEQAPKAKLQGAVATRLVTVHAASKSNSLAHLHDGYELNSDGQQGLGTPVSLASADFNEDGTPDLVTGYANGKLVLHCGNPDAIYPQGSLSNPHTQQRKANGRFTEEAFMPDAQAYDVPESADVIDAGDFNADGHQDVLVVARNSNSLYLLAGNGKGTFEAARQIEVKGQVTAMAAGEIGQTDGQTDVAVGVITEKGPQLLVYEHPEGAFKHAPEIFPLATPATDIVIGELDGDSFSDIAVATGNVLTIIHGRGQAYPWDLIKEVNIKRPPAIVATRALPFPIATLAIGQFGDGRGNSLALLAGDGSLYTLEPTQAKSAKTTLAPAARAGGQSLPSLPTGVDGTGLAIRTRPQPNGKTAQANGLLVSDSSQSHGDRIELMMKKLDEAAAEMGKLSKEELARLKTAKKADATVMRARAKQSFLRTVSAQPSTLAKWSLQSIVTDTRLSAIDQATATRLITARVSVSGRDDLVMLDGVGQQVQIVSVGAKSEEQGGKGQEQDTKDEPLTTNHGPLTAKVTTLPVDASPTAVLPMRLNGDALSDLVVLRHGASQPSVVLTAATAVFEVNDSGDQLGNCLGGGTCTLRSAIIAANGAPGSQITFNIPGAGVHTISPLTQLPVITANGTDIHASTQPGFAGFPLIEIKGNLISGTADGLKVRASSCYVGSFAINQFPFTVSGITFTGGSGVTVETQSGSTVNSNNLVVGNFLGTDPTGFIAKGSANGLLVFTADNTVINGNLLSANAGYGLDVTNANNSSIRSNRIGTAVDGLTKLGNVEGGVFLTGSGNQFGGDGGGNTVSGNGKPMPGGFPACVGGEGVVIPVLFNPDTGQLLTQFNEVKGNRIGTSFDGIHPVGNCHLGIDTDPVATTVIGSIAQSGRNIVSDNGLGAISCLDSFQVNFGDAPSEGGFCAIIGNNIGTDITGTTALPNDVRNLGGGLVFVPFIVEILNSNTLSNFGAPGGTTPGGDCTGFCNLLSGNGGSEALFLGNHGTVGAFNNYVGTNQSGTQALPNTNGGIVAAPYFGDAFIGAVGDQFDMPGISLGNLSASGVGAECPLFCFSDLTIEGNLFGTDAQGLNAIPSGGVSIFGVAGEAQIGGTDPLARNVISSSTGDGLFLNYNFSDGIKIVNNYIGVNQAGAPLGNAGAGISVMNYGAATIGGSTAEEENVIQNNGGSGIRVASSGSGLPSGVDIQRNKISSNGRLGIDLSNTGFTDDGVTAIDCQDSDTGPNELQNYPQLVAPVFNANGTVTVQGSLNSEPLRNYRIDFYYSSNADPSTYGEGENFIGSKNVSTSGGGGVAFDFTSTTAVLAGSVITATATNPQGSTSEFSCGAGVCTQASKNGVNQPLSGGCPAHDIVVNVTSDEPEDVNFKGIICNVDPNATSGNEKCTLHAAIQEAVYRSHSGQGRWNIRFDIPGAGVHTIAPLTFLPTIDQPVTIDGTSQPGYIDSPLIELSGINVDGGTTNGLQFDTGSGGSTVRGLTINSWSQSQISLSNTDETAIESCYLGIKPDGISATPDFAICGVQIFSSRALIGSSTGGGNVISNNFHGVCLHSKSSQIVNNKIGTDKTGTKALPNTTNGINWNGDLNGLPGAVVQIEGNLISGNGGMGIFITGSRPGTISKNLIGTKADGTGDLHNGGNGIFIGQSENGFQVQENTIVGVPEGPTDFTNGAIVIQLMDGSSITNNNIGVGADGVVVANSGYGILVASSNTNSITGNLVCGNKHAAIFISTERVNHSGTSNNNKIQNNYIGVDRNDSQNLGNLADGIFVDAGAQSTDIGDNVISGNGENGVYLSGSNQSDVHNNQIGTAATPGHPAIPNKIGIWVNDSSRNKVRNNTVTDNTEIGILAGTSVPAFAGPGNAATKSVAAKSVKRAILLELPENNKFDGNTVSNSKVGVAITEAAHNNNFGELSANTISGNTTGVGYGIFLGTTAETPVPALLPYGNTFLQTMITGNTVGLVIKEARDNLIGGDRSALGNSFFANAAEGISIFSRDSTGNQFTFNRIGVDPDDPLNSTRGNGHNGISINDTARNVIKNNIIGYNRGSGISIFSVYFYGAADYATVISGNQIGILANASGTYNTGNQEAGIRIEDSRNMLIGVDGVTSSEPKNIIGGNHGDGISIQGSSKFIKITNSIIGTTEAGEPNLGNLGNGIVMYSAVDMTIGGNATVGNVISGNGEDGIKLLLSARTTILGNSIGVVNVNGSNVALKNNGDGIDVLDSSETDIGASGAVYTYGNTIGGNAGEGILVSGVHSTAANIIRNLIGTDTSDTHLGNGLNGVHFTQEANHNNVGRQNDLESGNTIAHNSAKGVLIDDFVLCCNRVDPNTIYDNGGLGISLSNSDDPLPNDPGDADSGPNNLQNFPEFSSAIINASGNLMIRYRLDSLPENSNYGDDGIYVEFFKADASLQGQTFIGSSHYTIENHDNSAGPVAEFDAGNAGGLSIQVGDKLVATATDADGNTSEFTSEEVPTVVAAAPTAAPARVSGQVTTSNGQPLDGVTIRIDGAHSATTITDSAGRYSFETIETDNFYVVTPQRANYSFSPANRSFSLIANKTDAIFTAVADSTDGANPLDTPEFFVRQQYLDFLSREPDAVGFNYWKTAITSCGADGSCLRAKRIDVSDAFFYEREFQESGAFVYRLYKAALGRAPTFAQFQPDRAAVVGGANLEQSKAAFAFTFVQRESFQQAYPNTQTADQFVAALLGTIKQNSGVDLTARRASLVALYDGTDHGRAAIIRQLADNQSLIDAEYNPSFVLMQYFGYLRRDPDAAGFNFWLGQVNSAPLRDVGKQHAMVCSFITSAEYQQRFSSVVSHSNAECLP
jgi:parallel beta-helix repeat protein